MKLIKALSVLGYYLFAQHLPASDTKLTEWVRPIRRFFCKLLFRHIGINTNIEKGSRFGSGTGIQIGEYSGLGINCFISEPAKIGNYVMVGPDVMLLAQGHKYARLDILVMVQGEVNQRKIEIEDDV